MKRIVTALGFAAVTLSFATAAPAAIKIVKIQYDPPGPDTRSNAHLNKEWGFRKSKKIGPGLRLNLSKRSVGVSAGTRGARAVVNTRGRKSRSLGWKGFVWRT